MTIEAEGSTSTPGGATDRYLLLLGALLLLLGAAAFLDPRGVSGAVIAVLVWLVVLAGVRAGGVPSRTWRRAVLGATISLLILLPATLSENETIGAAVLGVLAAGMGIGPPIIVRRIFEHDRITGELIVAALCAYLQVGFAFGLLYAAIDSVAVDFFAQGQVSGLFDHIYFSFVTLTTIGYGDLTPAGELGKALVIFETLLGQVFLVVLVAFLVGNLAGRRAHRLAKGESDE